MSDPSQAQDELAGTEQPFVQHLVELRDRLINHDGYDVDIQVRSAV